MALLRESNVADTLVIWVHLEVAAVCYIVEIFDILMAVKVVKFVASVHWRDGSASTGRLPDLTRCCRWNLPERKRDIKHFIALS